MKKLYFLFTIIYLLVNVDKLNAQAPPYSGTIFIDGDIITSADPSTIQSTTYTGRGQKIVYDRRASAFITINAYLFNVIWNDGLTSEAIINPEFGSVALATVEAEKYAYLIGKLPYCLRTDVNEIWIHQGVQPFGGGNNSILIHTGQSVNYEASGILEETLVHEASHTSLDQAHASSTNWTNARVQDNNFISTYARDNPTTEDIAESFLTWLAVRYRATRISQTDYNIITQTIPNRLIYFDNQNFNLNPISGALPIKLVSFSAKLQNQNAVLNWATAQEQNSLKFSIERSEDASNWSNVGNVNAKGNSDVKNHYSFTDYNVLTNYYYRLKMIDQDGKFEYSPVERISIRNINTISFYPNPVTNIITLKNLTNQNIDKVAIANISGQRVLEFIAVNKQINVQKLPPGVYFLEIFTSKEFFRYKFVKQ
jgi:hypothetical protein